MTARSRVSGLYAVTPDLADTGLLVAKAAAAIAGGASLLQYRHKVADGALRLEQARTLLRNSALSVTETAVATGFESAAHFSRAYRQQYGRAPGVERQRTATARPLRRDSGA